MLPPSIRLGDGFWDVCFPAAYISHSGYGYGFQAGASGDAVTFFGDGF